VPSDADVSRRSADETYLFDRDLAAPGLEALVERARGSLETTFARVEPRELGTGAARRYKGFGDDHQLVAAHAHGVRRQAEAVRPYALLIPRQIERTDGMRVEPEAHALRRLGRDRVHPRREVILPPGRQRGPDHAPVRGRDARPDAVGAGR
jgi:hypothetical protein